MFKRPDGSLILETDMPITCTWCYIGAPKIVPDAIGGFRAECDKCAAYGFNARTEVEAATNWNDRGIHQPLKR